MQSFYKIINSDISAIRASRKLCTGDPIVCLFTQSGHVVGKVCNDRYNNASQSTNYDGLGTLYKVYIVSSEVCCSYKQFSTQIRITRFPYSLQEICQKPFEFEALSYDNVYTVLVLKYNYHPP